MGYSAKAIANYFLELAREKGESLSPLKIQKLVYIAHGWHLALAGSELVDDEFAEAWEYGPVFPSLYREFREFGGKPITRLATKLLSKPSLDVFLKEGRLEVEEPKIDIEDSETKELLDAVWSAYHNLSGSQLSRMTHASHTPWRTTKQRHGEKKNVDIDNSLIKKHYEQIAEKNRKSREESQT